jgi:predicted Zn-dependent protease with MMP-like domain
MNRDRFRQVVRKVLEEIPEPFGAHLREVEVVIEDEASADMLRSLGMEPDTDQLFGLYEGVPLDERADTESLLLPDRITIFYRPLVREFRTPWAIAREVRRTVIHEVGHFFGLDDEEIEKEGY